MTRFGQLLTTATALLLGSAAPALAAPAPVPDEIPVAMMVDLSSGQTLFARDIDRRFMPASVTKVMTVFSAFKLIHEGKVDPRMRYTVSQQLEDEWSGEGSTMFLKAGERPTFGQLLMGATTISGNDASVAIALATSGSLENWLKVMNQNAAALGMTNTFYHSPNGYMDEGKTFTSARDLVRLGSALTTHYPGLYRRYFGHHGFTWRDITQANHDPITGKVDGADGIKTGFTGEAGYTFLGSGERNGRRLVFALAGAPTARIRDQAARDLFEWGFDNFTTRPVVGKGYKFGEAKVQGGASRQVSLRTGENLSFSFAEGISARPSATVRYHGPIHAPIAKGAHIADLHVEIAGMESFDVPLLAGEDVPRANVVQRIANGFAGLFG